MVRSPVPNADSSGESDLRFQREARRIGYRRAGHLNYVNHVTGLHVNGEVDTSK